MRCFPSTPQPRKVNRPCYARKALVFTCRLFYVLHEIWHVHNKREHLPSLTKLTKMVTYVTHGHLSTHACTHQHTLYFIPLTKTAMSCRNTWWKRIWLVNYVHSIFLTAIYVRTYIHKDIQVYILYIRTYVCTGYKQVNTSAFLA